MGCYLTCPPECQGPRLTFRGRALSSIHTEQRRGPTPHCLSNNSDVKPFTESSGEASWNNIKRKKKGRGGGKKMDDKGDKRGEERRKAQPKLWGPRGCFFVFDRQSISQNKCCVLFGFSALKSDTADIRICLLNYKQTGKATMKRQDTLLSG